jgi:hypothetical protein
MSPFVAPFSFFLNCPRAFNIALLCAFGSAYQQQVNSLPALTEVYAITGAVVYQHF